MTARGRNDSSGQHGERAGHREDCAVLVDGVPAAARRDEVVNHGRRGGGDSRRASNHNVQALHALDSWTQAPWLPPFALLDATLALDSNASWLRQALQPGTSRTGCSLTGYAGTAAATARALPCRGVDALTAPGERLGAAHVLLAVQPPDLARLGRCASTGLMARTTQQS